MKTHVLIVSEHFPAYHPRGGQETDFADNIAIGVKKHTIRKNYEYWAPKIQEVQEGKAILSIRSWSGKPYNSPQIKHFELGADSVGIEKISMEYSKEFADLIEIKIEDEIYTKAHQRPQFDLINSFLWRYDGFKEEDDFHDWFQYNTLEGGCIIHFTDHRYHVKE